MSHNTRCWCGRPVPTRSLDGVHCAEHDDDLGTGPGRHNNGGIGGPRIDVDKVTRALLDGCATVDSYGRPYGGDGILVGVPEYGSILWDDDDLDGYPVSHYVRDWIKRVAPEVTSRADYWFGAWFDDDGYLHLDVAQSYSRADVDEARTAARLRGELYIYDAGRRVCEGV